MSTQHDLSLDEQGSRLYTTYCLRLSRDSRQQVLDYKLHLLQDDCRLDEQGYKYNTLSQLPSPQRTDQSFLHLPQGGCSLGEQGYTSQSTAFTIASQYLPQDDCSLDEHGYIPSQLPSPLQVSIFHNTTEVWMNTVIYTPQSTASTIQQTHQSYYIFHNTIEVWVNKVTLTVHYLHHSESVSSTTDTTAANTSVVLQNFTSSTARSYSIYHSTKSCSLGEQGCRDTHSLYRFHLSESVSSTTDTTVANTSDCIISSTTRS